MRRIGRPGHCEIAQIRRSSEWHVACTVAGMDPNVSNGDSKNIPLERVHVANRARPAHQTWTAILDNVGVGVVVANASGLVKYANPVAHRLLALETNGSQARLQLMRSNRSGSLELSEINFGLSGAAPLPDGCVLLQENRGPVLTDGVISKLSTAEGTEDFVIVFWDLAAHHPNERRRRSMAQLQALEAVASRLTQDLNDMVQVVLGGAGIAKHELDPKSRAYRLLTDVEQVGTRIGKLSSSLAPFAQGRRPEPRVCSLEGLIWNALHEAVKGATTTFTLESPPDLWPVLVDHAQVTNALMNLARNARVAMKEGGSIVVRARNISADGRVSLDGRRPSDPGNVGRYVEVLLSDWGPPIEAEDIVHAFDAFFVSESRGGGLELASAFWTLRRNGGALWVWPGLRRGVTFNVLLPAAPATLADESTEGDAGGR